MVLAAVLRILLPYLDTVRPDSQAQEILSVPVIGAGTTTADTTEGPDGASLLTGVVLPAEPLGAPVARDRGRGGTIVAEDLGGFRAGGVALLDEVLTFAVHYRALALRGDGVVAAGDAVAAGCPAGAA